MKNSKTRLFEYNGKKVTFDRNQFCFTFDSYRQANKVPVVQLENQIADAVFLSREAVHNWRNGYNGPADIQTIELLAGFLNVSSESLLADYKEESKKMYHFTDSQLEAAKKMTDSLWNYILMFSITEGFTTRVNIATGEQSFIGAGNDYQDEYYDKVSAVFQREYFSLHGSEVYNELNALLNDISSSYDSDYRFLSEQEIDDLATEMYPKYVNKWTNRLMGIILKYFHSESSSQNEKHALTERQRKAFKRLYEEILDCIERVRIANNGSVIDMDMYFAFQMELILHIYKQESFDLYGLELYDEIDTALDTLNRWVENIRNNRPFSETEADVRKQLLSLVDKYN